MYKHLERKTKNVLEVVGECRPQTVHNMNVSVGSSRSDSPWYFFKQILQNCKASTIAQWVALRTLEQVTDSIQGSANILSEDW